MCAMGSVAVIAFHVPHIMLHVAREDLTRLQNAKADPFYLGAATFCLIMGAIC